MPIVAERLPPQPDSTDIADLSRIVGCEWAAFSAQLPQSTVITAGRFNGRLVALAVLAPEDDTHSYDLLDLQVLDITRRRGVARQFLPQLGQLISEMQALRVNLRSHPYLSNFFVEMGFTPDTASPDLLIWRRG